MGRWIGGYRSVGLRPIPPEVRHRLSVEGRLRPLRLLALAVVPFSPCIAAPFISASDAMMIGSVLVMAVALAVSVLIANDHLQRRSAARRNLKAGTVEQFVLDERVQQDLDAMRTLGRAVEGVPARSIAVLSATQQIVVADDRAVPWSPPMRISAVAEPSAVTPDLDAVASESPPGQPGDRRLSAAELEELRAFRRSLRGWRVLLPLALLTAWTGLGVASVLTARMQGRHWVSFALVTVLTAAGWVIFGRAVTLYRRLGRDLRAGTVVKLAREDLLRLARQSDPSAFLVAQTCEVLVHANRPWTFDGVPAPWRRPIAPR